MNAEYNNICGMPKVLPSGMWGEQCPLLRPLIPVSAEIIRIYGHENIELTILIWKTVFSAQNRSVSGVRAAGDDSSKKLFRPSCGSRCFLIAR